MLEALGPQEPFESKNMEYENPPARNAVKNAARRFDQLAIFTSFKFRRNRSAEWVPGRLFHVIQYPRHNPTRSFWIVDRYVVGNVLEILLCRLRPDYLSHLDIRFTTSS